MTSFITKQKIVEDKTANRDGVDLFDHPVATGETVSFAWNWTGKTETYTKEDKKSRAMVLCDVCVAEGVTFPTPAELNAGQINSTPSNGSATPPSKKTAAKQPSLGMVSEAVYIAGLDQLAKSILEAVSAKFNAVMELIPEDKTTRQLAIDLIAESSFTQSIAERYGLTEPTPAAAPAAATGNCQAKTAAGKDCTNPAKFGETANSTHCGRHYNPAPADTTVDTAAPKTAADMQPELMAL